MDIHTELQSISQYYTADEDQVLARLAAGIKVDAAHLAAITADARVLINGLRQGPQNSLLQQVLQEFSLESEEGRALMALAESLLRVPDRAVAESLISDKLNRANWQQARHADNPLFIQASAVLLGLGGHLLSGALTPDHPAIGKLVQSFSAPVIHRVLMHMIRVLAGEFVYAGSISDAIKRAGEQSDRRHQFSFDMLGEAAISKRQAEQFLLSYREAIVAAADPPDHGHNISIKLSALSPHFTALKFEQVVAELVDRLDPLLALAAGSGVGVTLDAEEADKLDITLAVFFALFQRWGGSLSGRFGMAVQAYSLRAPAVLQCLRKLAQSVGAKVAVRLVKGAYWDTEIKQAQVAGLRAYPVFTEKVHTDISYLCCAHYLLENSADFFPQFATHNPVTLSHILHVAPDRSLFEFQRLYGMGEPLYDTVLQQYQDVVCRSYCPVGEYQQLLPYLVRRILENGANNSMVRQLVATDMRLDDLAVHPLAAIRCADYRHFNLPAPEHLFGDARKNSIAINLASINERETLTATLAECAGRYWSFPGDSDAESPTLAAVKITNPASGDSVGECRFVDATHAKAALQKACAAFAQWRDTAATERAAKLESFAEELRNHRQELIALLVLEAGKTLVDAIDEVREAEDFARYYALQGRSLFSEFQCLQGPVGEHNSLGWQGRGVFLCISPWNFPLAIFVGQVAAALAAGNCVLAKPAEDTPLIACRTRELLLQAGFPADVIQCLPGNGPEIANAILPHSALAGVAFTGSTHTAQLINRHLANRKGPIVPLIAETGGQNAMIVDSSALPEQVVKDVLHSAFFSAGQRCSALRVLFLQEDIYQSTIELLMGAMECLQLGRPGIATTDIGPIINPAAAATLQRYLDRMRGLGKVLYATPLPGDIDRERYVAPHLIAIDSMDELAEEHFGPVLHVIAYHYAQVDDVVAQIHRSRFGLTVGIQSRNQAFCEDLAKRLAVGNVYINRAMTGAVVGVQPFGGLGLSGTGPKAGGPNYLQRFAVEKTISNNIAAIGGNVGLLLQ